MGYLLPGAEGLRFALCCRIMYGDNPIVCWGRANAKKNPPPNTSGEGFDALLGGCLPFLHDAGAAPSGHWVHLTMSSILDESTPSGRFNHHYETPESRRVLSLCLILLGPKKQFQLHFSMLPATGFPKMCCRACSIEDPAGHLVKKLAGSIHQSLSLLY